MLTECGVRCLQAGEGQCGMGGTVQQVRTTLLARRCAPLAHSDTALLHPQRWPRWLADLGVQQNQVVLTGATLHSMFSRLLKGGKGTVVTLMSRLVGGT